MSERRTRPESAMPSIASARDWLRSDARCQSHLNAPQQKASLFDHLVSEAGQLGSALSGSWRWSRLAARDCDRIYNSLRYAAAVSWAPELCPCVQRAA